LTKYPVINLGGIKHQEFSPFYLEPAVAVLRSSAIAASLISCGRSSAIVSIYFKTEDESSMFLDTSSVAEDYRPGRY
jgi:hypothetical protein